MGDRVHVNVPNDLPTHVRIVPKTKNGTLRHELIPIQYYPTLGMTFEYHRRRYVYQSKNQTNNKTEDENNHDDDDDDNMYGSWHKIRCQTNFPLQILDTWTGYGTVQQMITGQI